MKAVSTVCECLLSLLTMLPFVLPVSIAADRSECGEGYYGCYLDCCKTGEMFCNGHPTEQRCQNCELQKEWCGTPQEKEHCTGYCYKLHLSTLTPASTPVTDNVTSSPSVTSSTVLTGTNVSGGDPAWVPLVITLVIVLLVVLMVLSVVVVLIRCPPKWSQRVVRLFSTWRRQSQESSSLSENEAKSGLPTSIEHTALIVKDPSSGGKNIYVQTLGHSFDDSFNSIDVLKAADMSQNSEPLNNTTERVMPLTRQTDGPNRGARLPDSICSTNSDSICSTNSDRRAESGAGAGPPSGDSSQTTAQRLSQTLHNSITVNITAHSPLTREPRGTAFPPPHDLTAGDPKDPSCKAAEQFRVPPSAGQVASPTPGNAQDWPRRDPRLVTSPTGSGQGEDIELAIDVDNPTNSFCRNFNPRVMQETAPLLDKPII